MKLLVVISLLLLSLCALAQQREILVSVSKIASNKDSGCVYQFSIKNNADSIACILHSMFIDLGSIKPQGLAVFGKSYGETFYTFDYSFRDTLYDFESQPYLGKIILPFEKLTFLIHLPQVDTAQTTYLNFKYFYLKDLHYRQFIDDMKLMTTWYRKYDILKMNLKIADEEDKLY